MNVLRFLRELGVPPAGQAVTNTRDPSGTRDRAFNAAAGTRTQPCVTAFPNTEASGQPCSATVPGPPPKVSRVAEWVPSGRTIGLGVFLAGARFAMRNVRPGGVGVLAPPTATFHRPTV